MTVLPGSSYFSSDESFAMIRGYVQPPWDILKLDQAVHLHQQSVDGSINEDVKKRLTPL